MNPKNLSGFCYNKIVFPFGKMSSARCLFGKMSFGKRSFRQGVFRQGDRAPDLHMGNEVKGQQYSLTSVPKY